MPNSSIQPIIPGFYPDPSICRAEDEYVLVNSSFEYAPAVPVWRSTDLVSWAQAGNALDRDDQFAPGHARSWGGIYAPTIRYHDGKFWLITTDVSGVPGQLVAWADAPEGPWSRPTVIAGLHGIDPDLFWDEDGSCLVTYSSNEASVAGIAQARVDLERGEILEPPRAIWSGTGLAHPEAPHLYRRGSWWYLMIAEGGTERGHAVSIARATAPTGPFEPCPSNPIFSRRSQSFPVQNAGHGDLVEREDGTWAMVYLGARPAGETPLFHVNGRETFVAGVTWANGWPTVHAEAFEVPRHRTDFVDRFDDTLDPRWVSPGRALRDFVVASGDGGADIVPGDDDELALLAVRTRDPRWAFTARTVSSAGAAVRVRMDDHHWYELRTTVDHAEVHAHVGPVESTWREALPDAGGVTELTVRAVDSASGGPDDLLFEAARGGECRTIARLDGRYVSTEVAGGFVGRVVGVRAIDRIVRLLEARYEAHSAPAAH